MGEPEGRAAGLIPAVLGEQSTAGINPAARQSVGTFRASDGYAFYYRRYDPPGRPLARIVFVHGIRSHGGWYTRSCEALAAAGYEVYFLDRRGSGLNTAHRGDCPSFRRLLDDVAEFLQRLRADRGYLPVFLAGISWGGKLAVGVQYRKPGLIDGLILLAPGIKPLVKPSFGERLRIFLASRVRPTRLFPIPLNEPDLFTASPDWQRYIDREPHGLRRATARFLFASFALDVYLRRAARRVKVPTLLMLAGHDRIIDNAKTRAFLAKFRTVTTVVDYPGAHHTLEFEPAAHPWLDDLRRWLGARLTSRTSPR